MAELKQFKLPDVGEGLTEADILRWDVKVGDSVVVNQVLVEVETAKAAVELPSPYAGVVHEIHFDEGATVDVGQPIITLRVGAGELAGSRQPAARPACRRLPRPPVGSAAEDLVPTPELPAHEADQELQTAQRQAVLVGYGVSGERARRRKRAAPVRRPAGADRERGLRPDPEPRVRPPRWSTRSGGAGQAAGPQARQDPRRRPEHGGARPGRTAPSPARTSSRRLSTAGRGRRGRRPASAETRIPIKGVRKHTAAAMVSSAFTAPHVTEFITVDVTETMELRKRVGGSPGVRRRQGLAAAVRRPGAAVGGPAHPDHQLHLGRGGRRDRRQALRQPRASRRPPTGA